MNDAIEHINSPSEPNTCAGEDDWAQRDLVQKIDLLIAQTERLDGFREEAHRRETLDVYGAARDVLIRRLDSR